MLVQHCMDVTKLFILIVKTCLHMANLVSVDNLATPATGAWASYQIRKTGCSACAGNAGTVRVFPATDFTDNR